MKHTKKMSAFVGAAVLVTMFFVGVPLHTMISQKSVRLRTQPSFAGGVYPELVEGAGRQPERHKNKLIWVKTSDNVRMELPQWQIDQMKAVQHKGEGTKHHWVDAPMITSDELELVQKALNVSDNLENFRQFYANLSEDQKGILINAASKLEMQGLTSLLMAYFFPMPVQEQIGTTLAQKEAIIAPVVEYLYSKIEIEKKILKGHVSVVRCVAYSPDGNHIVSGSKDNNLILWNGKTGEQIKILKGHNGLVQCVAYSPDGKYIVSGSNDKNLILWDGKTGDQIKVLEGHTDIVRCVAYSPDGNCIVSGSKDNTLILWNGKTGDKIKVLEGHIDDDINWLFHGVNCVAYSPDSNYIVSGAYDHNLILWNGKTGEQINVLEGHRGFVDCVAYSPDGNYIISGGFDSNLILWNGKTGEKIKVLEGHDSGVHCVAYSPDGNYIVSGSGEGRLILWNGKTGDKIRVFEGHADVDCVAYSPDGNDIVSGSNNLILRNGKTGDQIKILEGHANIVRCVAYSPNGNYIVSCSWHENNLILWKLINDQINYIATQLNIAQARFLHRLYLAQKNEVPVILDTKDADYQIYLTLPQDVQKVIKEFLPFELASAVVEKTVQEKMNELRSSLFYTKGLLFGKSEKTRDQKIKALKDVMQKVEKDSVDYKACIRLLNELELEAAFEVD